MRNDAKDQAEFDALPKEWQEHTLAIIRLRHKAERAIEDVNNLKHEKHLLEMRCMMAEAHAKNNATLTNRIRCIIAAIETRDFHALYDFCRACGELIYICWCVARWLARLAARKERPYCTLEVSRIPRFLIWRFRVRNEIGMVVSDCTLSQLEAVALLSRPPGLRGVG